MIRIRMMVPTIPKPNMASPLYACPSEYHARPVPAVSDRGHA